MNLENKVIEAENGKNYLIIITVTYEERVFGYLVNKEDETDTLFMELCEDSIKPIVPEFFEEFILPLFLKEIQKINKDNKKGY